MGSDGAPRADVVRQRRKRHLDDSATLRVPTKGGLYLMVDARRLSPRWSTPAAEDPQRPVAGNERATAPAGVRASWRGPAPGALRAAVFPPPAPAIPREVGFRPPGRQRTHRARILPPPL